MFELIAGHDPRDATSSRRALGTLPSLDTPVRGLRLALPENYYFDGVTADVRGPVETAARTLASLGAQVRTLRVPDPAPMIDVCNVLARSESATIHARIVRERPHELGATVRSRLEVGFQISAHDYLQAGRLRARLTRAFVEEVFADVDALLAPTIPEPAPALAEVTAPPVEDIVRRMGRFSRLTRPFNGLGLPVLSVPAGFTPDGRPVGLQIVGRPFDEGTILRLGHAWERAADWPRHRPTLSWLLT
jgi:aspartyl-tRNA(Asn)/glutamyl-tRNA(Gln) amidotransferase subunit A